jgi:hypothetical protein
MAEKFVQVGFGAFRDPKTGEFLQAVPLYAKREDVTEGAEEKLLADFGKLMAKKMKAYVDACEAQGHAVGV